MAKFVESCGGVSENTSRVATNGIKARVALGAPAYFFYTPANVTISNPEAARDIDAFNTLIEAGNGISLGKFTVESTGSEREVYEDTFFGIKVTTTDATKTLQLTAPMCSCVSAEFEKLNGRSGYIWEITTAGYLLGRMNDDGSVQGFPVSNMYKAINSIASTDTPVSNTILEIPYTDPRGDQKSPFQIPVDWNFEDCDLPFSVEAEAANFIDAGTSLTFDLSLFQDCTTTPLTGAVKADFKVTDANGAEITTFTVSESSGVYSFDVTTDESVVYVETNGFVRISGSLFTMDEFKVSAA
ncbi:structural protein [Cellulophaga phage Nekkels_1]|uniref:Structural protein n=1 Tax=Cellulophaga phage Nekkels_1 TaxID=2745692 RepID=A0A8E4UXG5_9CAUD|nr:structural protein [Cellulophaga phage Nekkels_1]QQO97046.1 structural protein [Cellulophaga phage Nekkels_1]QQO97139.1 structural protein [Cellulophaga phage Nekkels_2]